VKKEESVIEQMVQGTMFYKKFSNRPMLNSNEKAFDPLFGDKVPPEQCGYGMRFVQLDPSLKFISIRHNLKNVDESQIPVNWIVKLILPSVTMDIIKLKKLQKASKKKKTLTQIDLVGTHHSDFGTINKRSEMYRDKCLETYFFPFSIAIQEQG
jgi:hypothetical protein